MPRIFASLLPAIVLVACAEPEGGERTTFFFPDGDPEAGRTAFTQMQCYACHGVIGDDFPEPHATPPLPDPLGPDLAAMSRGEIAEAIIAPYHPIPDDLEAVRRGEVPQMGDYSEAMTVRQLIDIVGYLERLGRQ